MRHLPFLGLELRLIPASVSSLKQPIDDHWHAQNTTDMTYVLDTFMFFIYSFFFIRILKTFPRLPIERNFMKNPNELISTRSWEESAENC